jgi:hypothetical protein
MNAATVKKTVKRAALKQSRPRIWLGALRDIVQRTQAYYALINASLLLITTYTVREATIKAHFPWFNFGWLAIALIVFVVVVALTDYKVIYPSQVAYHQFEAWKHRSPVRRDMEAMKQELDLIKEAVARVEEKLDGR